MSFYALSGLINAITSLGLGIFVFTRNSKNIKNITYGLFCLSVFLWSVFYFLWLTSKEAFYALLFSRCLMAGAIFIPVFYLHHLLLLFGLEKKKFKVILLSYLFGFFSLSVYFTPYYITDVSARLNFPFWPTPGILYHPFLLAWFFIVVYGEYIIIKEYLSSRGSKRNQIRYILLATLIGWGGGATNFMLWYDIPIPPIGNILVSGYVILTTYAIVRYRLMDIRVAVTRFGIFAIVYTLVLGIPFWIGYKYHLWHYSTLVMGVLATLGPFIYIRLEKRGKELIYKIEFKRYETLRRFSKTLLLIKELDKLVELIVYRLVKTLKVTYAGIYLYDKERDAYVLKSYRPLKYPNMPNGEALTKESLLIKLLFIWRRELIREEVANLPLGKKVGSDNHIDLGLVQYEMRKLSATLIIPHFVENDLLGFLVLGDKEKGAIYTEEDISILSALSNSAALAIENALFLIDLKITQAELFNTKRIAELGYMASAMGHEINNRLQAIYSAGLDMIDNPVIYDAVKNNPQAKESFDNDIKHINENIEDATAIINELKTYARPQDKTKQNLEPLNLNDVIDKALRVVKLQSAKAFDMIEVDLDIPKTLSKTLGNFIQLQQVFVNLLNNAHDAILEKKNYASTHSELNLVAYKGKIQIKVEEVKNLLDIHVIDNGIGMTEDIKKRLFIPLYTSKATAERKAQRGMKGGTGIGLYTIQTIIRGHNGAISAYDTQWLKGTNFLITLPIAREKDLQER